MNYYEVSPIGIVGKDFTVMTYSFSANLANGLIVEIPVGQRKFVGVVFKKVAKPDFECKEILRVLFDKPLPPAILKLHSWLSEFYTTHPSTVWQTMLPAGLNKKRRAKTLTLSPSDSFRRSTADPRSKSDDDTDISINSSSNRTNFVFNNEQLSAIDALAKMKSGTAILHGITGSGKTAVYKALATQALSAGKSSIILVPEISLTTQLVNEFRANFDNVILTHSAQTEAQRAAAWQSILAADKPVVVIGPRSALFMPVRNLGLIVIDECHEPSYKQEKAPRYNALRAASILAQYSGAKLILGSATPLIADYFTAQRLGRPIVEMKKLARENAQKPTVKIIDLTKRDNFISRSKIFSRQLLAKMLNVLDDKKQILLFHNRRGSASTTLCENCGFVAMCPRCFLPFTLHADKFELRCHICGKRDKPPTKCPDCDSTDILHKGIGTKRIEEEIKKLFPDKTVRRFDGDTVRGETVAEIYDELKSGQIDIIIGTQTIAKGLDLPNLALVGIVQADAGLMLPDFSSSERTFQLIAQACGRVGRGHEQSTVIVQSYQPDAPAVRFGATQNYPEFYDMEITNRQRGHFPPFAHLLKLTCIYKTEKGAVSAATKLAKEIREKFDVEKIKILGPAPAFYERARDTYRWQIVVRASNREVLKQIAAYVASAKTAAKWQIELDPNSLT